MRRLLPCAAALLVGVSSQVLGQSVLRLGNVKVEVVGLHRWTIPMLQDSLARYAPGDSLQYHACAVALRQKLHFADAAATRFVPAEGDSTTYVLVTVVEPQDSARVRYLPGTTDTSVGRAEWADLANAARTNPGAFQDALFSYLPSLRGGPGAPVRGQFGPDSLRVAEVWAFLRAHRSPADRDAAVAAIASAPSMWDRVAGAAILENFGSDEPAWIALTNALRQDKGMTAAMAGEALVSIARANPRPIDWTPAVPTIHAVLDGTSLFELGPLLETLMSSGIDRRWASPFLANGGHMILEYLHAENPALRRGARAFLTQLAGQDFGDDPARWEAWVRTL